MLAGWWLLETMEEEHLNRSTEGQGTRAEGGRGVSSQAGRGEIEGEGVTPCRSERPVVQIGNGTTATGPYWDPILLLAPTWNVSLKYKCVCVCIYICTQKLKSNYTAIHTYSASSMPENFHSSSKHVQQRPEKGRPPSRGRASLAGLPQDNFCWAHVRCDQIKIMPGGVFPTGTLLCLVQQLDSA